MRTLSSVAAVFCWMLLGCSKPRSAVVESASASPGLSTVAVSGGNLLKNADFSDGTSLPWTTSFSDPARGEATVKDGGLCLVIEHAGANKWDAQLRHREMTIQKGHQYTVAFTAWASAATKIVPKVGMAGPPYAEYWNQLVELGPQKRRFVGQFVMNRDDDPTAEFAFHMGGNLVKSPLPVTVCIDNVNLNDPQFTPAPKQQAAEVPELLVNQLGYLPTWPKWATLKSRAKEPLGWQLLDAAGEVVASGKTQVFGGDAASAEDVHRIDFSEATRPGQGYVLQVGESQSDAFAIDTALYHQLKYDALAYFYHNRSGLEIKLPYARQAQWARRAGHLPDKATCAPDAQCQYTLDVTGGWYDAGDHGKYVVNGGISVWTLLNQWERTQHLSRTRAADFGDKKLNIPESGNRVPDLLDEARWELEFLLEMQVPEGQPLAGMVHHKVHDDSWTALGLQPADDPKPRVLRPPSTAATLNMAAVAAQGARIWSKLDAKFSRKLREAAENAWTAARKHPAVFALPSDNRGGGPYDDDYVDDEFYWAAAELFITTGRPEYREALVASKHHQAFKTRDGFESIMTWQVVDALGVISLASVPSALTAGEVAALRKRLVAEADRYLEHVSAQGYRTPFHPGKSWKYPWGSNSFVLNNMLVLALAYDFTKDDKYKAGVAAGADYLLGNNPLGQSYVTGYGARPLQNPHHRFWAHQAHAQFPSAPPGCVSGGPNSGLQDPYVQAAGLKGCAAAQCFVDNIEAWSTNEITINWNAPLAWVAAFLDEHAK